MGRRSNTQMLRGVLVLAACLSIAFPAVAAPPQFWFGGVDPVVQKDRHTDNPADYMDMFKPGAPWQTGEAALGVFGISTQMVLRGTDEQLRTILDSLKSRHIALAVELGLLAYSDRCGKGAEGYGAPLAVDAVARRLKSVGGVLDYVVMDEPVTWGHTKTGMNAMGMRFCQDDVASLANQSAPKIALLRQYFPNIKIGQIDSINGRYPQQGESAIAFIDALNAKIGLMPSFFHIDVAWDSNYQPGLLQLIQQLRQRGIRVGVVFDGNLSASSDQEWIAQALQRFQSITANPRTHPDDLLFTTWSVRPARMLPETDPSAWSYALRYGAMAVRHSPRSTSVSLRRACVWCVWV